MLGNRGGFERQMSARIQNDVEQPEEDGEIGQSENSEVKGGSNLSQNPVVSGVTMGASGCGMGQFLDHLFTRIGASSIEPISV